jgi:hypothetical protein
VVNIDLRAAVTRTTSRVLLAAAAATAVAGLAAAPASAAPATPEHRIVTASTSAAGHSAAAPVAAVQAAAPVQAAPAKGELMPAAVSGQQTFTPSAEQRENAEAIIATGQKLKLPPRAWVIALATSLQETTLHNYGHLGDRNDHDSQGLFQQRPSAGWGTPEQITDPEYAATAFYRELMNVEGWNELPLTAAAQAVQVSAFPDHYAKWEQQAVDLVLAHYGQGPYAQK